MDFKVHQTHFPETELREREGRILWARFIVLGTETPEVSPHFPETELREREGRKLWSRLIVLGT